MCHINASERTQPVYYARTHLRGPWCASAQTAWQSCCHCLGPRHRGQSGCWCGCTAAWSPHCQSLWWKSWRWPAWRAGEGTAVGVLRWSGCVGKWVGTKRQDGPRILESVWNRGERQTVEVLLWLIMMINWGSACTRQDGYWYFYNNVISEIYIIAEKKQV